MPVDIQNLTVAPLNNANVNVPRFQISAQVFWTGTTTLAADFTGANVINFPAVMGQLTAEQRQYLIDMIVTTLIQMRAGLLP